MTGLITLIESKLNEYFLSIKDEMKSILCSRYTGTISDQLNPIKHEIDALRNRLNQLETQENQINLIIRGVQESS